MIRLSQVSASLDITSGKAVFSIILWPVNEQVFDFIISIIISIAFTIFVVCDILLYGGTVNEET